VQDVITRVTVQTVAEGACRVAAEQDVVASAALSGAAESASCKSQGIVAFIAEEGVEVEFPSTAIDGVVSGTAMDLVITFEGIDGVVAAEAVDDVVIRRAGDRVVAIGTDRDEFVKIARKVEIILVEVVDADTASFNPSATFAAPDLVRAISKAPACSAATWSST
jgi:hypothetical protein